MILPLLNRLSNGAFCTRQNAFFNFTTENKVNCISETNRRYDQFEFTEAFVENDRVYTVAHIHGSSFLYN